MKHDTKIVAQLFFLRQLQIPLFCPPLYFGTKYNSENKHCRVLL